MPAQPEAKERRFLPLEQPGIDFILLADRAEVLNGKLYVMGGAWTELGIIDFAMPANVSLAIGVLVPWNATDEDVLLKVFFETEDGTRIRPEISANLNVGRPPGAVRGQEFRSIIAVNVAIKFPAAGMYRAVATLGEMEQKHTTFRVLLAQAPPQLRRQNS